MTKLVKRRLLWVLLIACVLGTGVIFIPPQAVEQQLDAWQLVPAPERVTELYFADSQKLPSTAKANSTQKVAFTIYNIEHQKITYHYSIVAMSDSSGTPVSQLLRDGVITLESSQYQTVNETITVPAIGKSIAVRVNLDYLGIALGKKVPSAQRQSIDYKLKIIGESV